MTPEQVNERLDARFNAVDAEFKKQRVLLIVLIVGIIAQIINGWIILLRAIV